MQKSAAMPQWLEKSAISPSGRTATTATECSLSSGIHAVRPASSPAERASSRPSTHSGRSRTQSRPLAFPAAQMNTTFSSRPFLRQQVQPGGKVFAQILLAEILDQSGNAKTHIQEVDAPLPVPPVDACSDVLPDEFIDPRQIVDRDRIIGLRRISERQREKRQVSAPGNAVRVEAASPDRLPRR